MQHRPLIRAAKPSRQARIGRAVIPVILGLSAAGCSPPGKTAASSSPAASASPGPDIAAVHRTLLVPGSEMLYSAESAPPAAAEAWRSIRQGADMVARGAEQMPPPPSAASVDWSAMLARMKEAASSADAASAAADPDQLRAADDKLAAACTACHDAFARPAS